MELELENTQRTVWDVKDRVAFFKAMRPLLNIDDDDADEIAEQLVDSDFDYLEIAAYFTSEDEDPDASLVFDGKIDVYWDVYDCSKTKQLTSKIQATAGKSAKLNYIRGLTQRDWRKRFEALTLA